MGGPRRLRCQSWSHSPRRAQALSDAIAEARSEELQRERSETGPFDLFEANGSVQSAPVPVVNGHQGPGRPVGARNKRTNEAARFHMSRFGDPLARGIEIAAIPILAQGGRVLLKLSEVLGMSRADELAQDQRGGHGARTDRGGDPQDLRPMGAN